MKYKIICQQIRQKGDKAKNDSIFKLLSNIVQISLHDKWFIFLITLKYHPFLFFFKYLFLGHLCSFNPIEHTMPSCVDGNIQPMSYQ